MLASDSCDCTNFYKIPFPVVTNLSLVAAEVKQENYERLQMGCKSREAACCYWEMAVSCGDVS